MSAKFCSQVDHQKPKKEEKRKNKKNNVIRLREQSDVLLFSLLQKSFIVSSERSAFIKRLLVEEF